MRSEVDLALLQRNIDELRQTPYFDEKVTTFLARLSEVVVHVQENLATYDSDVVRVFASLIWDTQKYVAGTTSNEVPYEVQICLTQAANDWLTNEYIFTTALLEDKMFHFKQAGIWQFVAKAISGYDTQGYTPILMQMALPRIYQYKPLYCIPLYHELVDKI